MTSEIGRMFKCLKNKSSYHSLQDDAYSHITLLQTEETNSTSQSNEEINSETTITKHSDEIIPSSPKDKTTEHNSKSCFKTRSLDSLTHEEVSLNGSIVSNTLECHLNENIVSSNRSISPTDQTSFSNCSSPAIGENSNIIGKTVANNNNNNSNNNSSSSGSSTGGGGGLFSFLGLKFNKSSTRHLDRSGDSSDKTEPCNPNRYTKFPLRGNTSSTSIGGGQALEISSDSSAVTPDPSSTSSRSSVESHSQSSSETSSAPPSNSKFDISQIQLTSQTKFYSNPHRSPSSRKGTFSPSNFISKSISSFGKKSASSANHKLKSSGPFYKRKSKSDNNLHRIDLSSVGCSRGGNSSSLFSNILGASGSGSSSRRGIGGGVSSSSQNIYNSEPGAELRLNSVQIGDHATIVLPWTGLEDERNNLSSTTSSRIHQNTHNNNFDSSSGGSGVRYVECGFKWSRAGDEPRNHFGLVRPEATHTHLRHIHHNHHRNTNTATNSSSSIEYTSCTAVRRRSKSLERDAGHRINPRNSIACSTSSAGTLNSSHSSACSTASSFASRGVPRSSKGSKLGRESSPNANFGLPQVRRCLTPEEQEILLRNISWDSFSLEPRSETPPPRPEKPASLRNKFISSSSSSSSCNKNKPFWSNSTSTSSPSSSSSCFTAKKPPHIGAIHRSAPNSFSVSSDSNDSLYNYSAPPSPPPRPPSSLKPSESRLISPTIGTTQKTQRILTKKAVQSGGVVKSNSFKTPSPSSHTTNSSHVEPSNNSNSTIAATGEVTNDKVISQKIPPSSASTETTVSESHQSSATSGSGVTGNPSSKMSIVEETQNSRFIHKPMKGWLHADQLLSKEGVSYTVRYIGCLDVNKSMKSLDFETRSLIAKECINQVCEAAGMKSVDRKGKFDRNVMKILGTRPRLEKHAGSDVLLTITSTCLKLTSLETGAVISSHEMPNISFASGGDSTMLDFIAFVAKDPVVGRACFILECGSGLAQDVIITIGQAFELRFKEYIQKRPPPPRLPAPDDREYYNDLPGKLPPTDDRKANGNNEGKTLLGGKVKDIPTLTLPVSSDQLVVNLIDFEAPTPPAFTTTQERNLESLLLGPDSPTFQTPSSVTASASIASTGTGLGLPNSPSQPNKPGRNKDPFDMQPFAADLPKPLSGPEQRKQLETQNWFHGCISRHQAEKLVKNDGDFLVRESQTTSGQYVLTGLQSGSPKHLLLVDPVGVVRTKDQTFDNVIHLVRHHSDNCLPIISAESMVILRHPVLRESVPLP